MKKKVLDGKMLRKFNLRIASAVSALLTLIAIGTVSYRILEGWTWIQAFYFAVATISTVGYGDLSPTTDGSRLFTAIYILVGVAIAVSALGVIGMNYLEIRQKRIHRKRTRTP
jgi:hypothetical protein